MTRKPAFISVLLLMSLAALAGPGNAIDEKYRETGAAVLGKPAGAETSAAGGGRVRRYASGGIWWSKATGAHAVFGATYAKYRSLQAERGQLGYPVADTLLLAGGSEQTLFRHGYIVVGKNGELRAGVMPKATFNADRVILGGMKAVMQKDSFLLPESPANGGTTFSCNCVTKGGGTGTGSCDIRTTNDVIRCTQVNCRNNCRLVLQ